MPSRPTNCHVEQVFGSNLAEEIFGENGEKWIWRREVKEYTTGE